jgi:hypothetical protein
MRRCTPSIGIVGFIAFFDWSCLPKKVPESAIQASSTVEAPAANLLRNHTDIRGQVLEEQASKVFAQVVDADYDAICQDFKFLCPASLTVVFPELSKLPEPERVKRQKKIVDQWLIDNFAYIAPGQFKNETVNTPIARERFTTSVFRPEKYGRAFLVDLQITKRKALQDRKVFYSETLQLMEQGSQYWGMGDIKGVGVSEENEPRMGFHGSGLGPFAEFLREWLFYRAVKKVLHSAGSEFKPLPHYAVLLFDFDVKLDQSGFNTPAGALIRRAHHRDESSLGRISTGPRKTLEMKIESLVRRHGLTSSGGTTRTVKLLDSNTLKMNSGSTWKLGAADFPEGLKRLPMDRLQAGEAIEIELINVQQTADSVIDPPSATIIDFGAWAFRPAFSRPFMQLSKDRSYYNLVFPGETAFVQVDPSLSLPKELWDEVDHLEVPRSNGRMGVRYSKGDVFKGAPKWLFKDGASLFSHGLARDLKLAKISVEDVRRQIQSFLGD